MTDEPKSGRIDGLGFDFCSEAGEIIDAKCKWCNDGCGWYTSHSGGFARWVPCDVCNSDGTAKRDPRALGAMRP